MGKKSNRQPIRVLPFQYYFSPLVLLTLIGLGASFYLALSHYRIHTDPTYSSFCAVSRALNCDTVSSSPYAILFNVPMSIWGIVGYGIILSILVWARDLRLQKKRMWPTLFWISFLYSICSIVLAWISSRLIHSYCIMCVLTYLVNFSLLYYAWFINRRFGDAGLFKGFIFDLKAFRLLKKKTIPVAVSFSIIAAVLVWAMPPYWQMKLPELDDAFATGLTAEGAPWIGADNPILTINEFSDYRCFQCKKMHFLLRRLIAAHPDKIRLVHRQFPMDRLYNPLVADNFHGGSGKMSIIALYATLKGKFWEVNDLLFEIASKKQDFNTRTIAKSTNIPVGELTAALKSKALRLKLKHDIAVGLKYGITGTPGFVIDDHVYIGTIPEEILRKGTSDLE